MAKLRRPSLRSIDLYNQLVGKQNEIRKNLSRVHKQAEETIPTGRLPALVIPKKARKITQNYFTGISKTELRRRLRAFWSKYRRAKEMFSRGMQSYLKKTVMEGYMSLWKEQIGVDPAGYRGKYTKEQIEYSDLGRAMEAYNMLFTYGKDNVDFFMALLYTHNVTEFKYIYDDLTGKVDRNYYLNDQIEKIEMYLKSPKARADLYKKASFLSGLYEHPKNIVNESNKALKKENDKKIKELLSLLEDEE